MPVSRKATNIVTHPDKNEIQRLQLLPFEPRLMRGLTK